jgi:hypothetical protein
MARRACPSPSRQPRPTISEDGCWPRKLDLGNRAPPSDQGLIKAHWDSLCGCDFFNVEVLGLGGAVRYLVFFVIVLKTRAVEIAGVGSAGHADTQI